MFIAWCLSEVGQQTWMLEPIPADAVAESYKSASEISPHTLRQRYPGAPVRYRICRLSIAEKLYDAAKYPLEVRSVQINPFQMLREAPPDRPVPRYNNRLAEARRRALDDLVGAWILDSHSELRAAWEAVRALPRHQRAPLEKDLFAPPCEESVLFALRTDLADPRRRIAIVTDWLRQARNRYQSIRTAAQRYLATR
jgi:hypothetical protein